MTKNTISILSSIGCLLTAAIWGFAFVVVKDSLDYIGPIWMMAFRFTIAAAALVLVFIQRLRLITLRVLRHGAMLGLCMFIAFLIQTIGCDYTTAGKNAFLTTSYVFFVPLFAWPLFKKRPALHVFFCALLSIVGMALLALNPADFAGTDGSRVNKGDVLTLISGIFFALHIALNAKYNREHSALLLTVLQFVFAAIFSWMSAPFFDGAFPLAQVRTQRVVVSMLYLGLFSTMVAFVLQNVSLKFLPSPLAALLLSFESVFGVLFSMMLLHELLTVRMALGCVLIFVAVVLAQVLPEKSRGEKK